MSVQNRSLDEDQFLGFGVAPPGQMTEQEFVAWCDEDVRAEWVDGEVIMMTPVNVEHSGLDGWLVTLLGIFVEERDLGVVLQDVQVRLATQRRRRSPDILFLAKDRLHLLRGTHLDGPPELVIEIVSPESEARDWREKYFEYQAAGVREYWVIDPMSQHLEAYVLSTTDPSKTQEPVEEQYRRLAEKDGIIASTVLPGFFLRTAWLWPATRPKVLNALRELGVLD